VRGKRTRQRRQVGLIRGLPITVQQPSNVGKEQQAVIALVAGALYTSMSREVNYDHVRLTVPKAQLPLDYRKHRYDVACLLGRRVILVDVLSVDVRYWQQGGRTEHGEGKE